MKYLEKDYANNGYTLHYVEVPNDRQPLVMLHGQGVDCKNFDNVFKALSLRYHIFSLDCFGHGKSSHDPALYTLKAAGEAVKDFCRTVAGGGVTLIGHSSGGLIAAYAAADGDACARLYLEDPPLFSCEGERRLRAYNYLDLSTACHNYLASGGSGDFVLYYFEHQKAWDFFPEDSRDKLKAKLVEMAKKRREKAPDKDLKVPFWPKVALNGFRGMGSYDPRFGEAFYSDSFNAGVSHEELLSNIRCETVIMKAKTNFALDGALLAAMTDEDCARAAKAIKNSRVEHFDCGHGLHVEREKEFLRCMMN